MIEPLVDTFDRWWSWLSEDYQVLKFRFEQRLYDHSIAGRWTASDQLRPSLISSFDELNRNWHFRPTNPVLITLQIRAAWTLFDWLDLDRVPSLYWTLLRKTPDPSAALLGLALSLDVDPLQLRQRDPGELARFQVGARLLAQCDANPMSLRPADRIRLEALSKSGATIRAHELQGIIVCLNEAVELFELQSIDERFSEHAAVYRSAKILRERVARVTSEEAQKLQDHSRDWCDITLGFRLAAIRKNAIAHIAENTLPSILTVADIEAFNQEANSLFEAFDELVEDHVAITKEKAVERLSKVEMILETLTSSLKRRHPTMTVEMPKIGLLLQSHSISGLAELRRQNALLVLGLRPDGARSQETIAEAFRRLVLDQFPIIGRPEYRQRALSYRMAVRHREALLSVL